MIYDVLVIGSGPAGISAAIYAKRSNLEVLIVSKKNSALLKAHTIENYYGIKALSGQALFEEGLKQASYFNIEIKDDEVTNLQKDFEHNLFSITTTSTIIKSKTVIIATGINRNLPNIANLKAFENKGLSFCAICDGFFYRHKPAFVLGTSNYALSEALELKKIASEVTILTNGEEPSFDQTDITINNKKIKNFIGSDTLEEIIFEDNSSVKVKGLFIAWGIAGGFEFGKKVGAETISNKIVVDDNMTTSVPGLFACGDVTGGLYQVSKAVYEGTLAGLASSKYIKELNKNG